MKSFYKKHPLLVILTSIVLALTAGVVVLSTLLVPQGKTSQSKGYALYTLKKQADYLFKGSVVASESTDYLEDSTLGELAAINVVDGQEVKAGDVLLTYTKPSDDLTTLAFAVKSAENDLANAQVDLAETEKKDAALRTKYDKAKEEADKQVITDQIELNREAGQTAQRSVTAANLALEQAQTTLSHQQDTQSTQVTSKTAGIVVLGARTEASPLLRVVSRDTLVNGTVSEYDYDKLKLNASVTVESIDLKHKVSGKITYISPVPEQATAAETSSQYSFKVSLDQSLQNGYTVQVHLADSALYIPNSALKAGRVYVKVGDKYQATAVDTKEVDGRLQVLSGLKVGDKLIREAADYVD
ncbi:MAG: HlyD family efflux transporter periplasmic adaptor subunit [Streptococcaceae bacterium]|jgi:HlyD family secretion protein|nr:HlyD family efflux transporter periplasmic adaptor subunit [Streptococcaceae bacterium]